MQEEGLSVWQSCQHHTITDRQGTGGNNGAGDTCAPGKSATPQPQGGDTALAAVAAGVGPTAVPPLPSSLKQE